MYKNLVFSKKRLLASLPYKIRFPPAKLKFEIFGSSLNIFLGITFVLDLCYSSLFDFFVYKY